MPGLRDKWRGYPVFHQVICLLRSQIDIARTYAVQQLLHIATTNDGEDIIGELKEECEANLFRVVTAADLFCDNPCPFGAFAVCRAFIVMSNTCLQIRT